MTMCDAHQRFISPPSSFKALVAMKATRAARKAAIIDVGMKVYAGLKAQVKVVRRRVRIAVGRERFHRQLHREAMLAAKQGNQ